MATATLSSKSQIVLPAEIRKRMGINPGDTLILEVVNDHIVMRKAPVSFVDSLDHLGSELWSSYADELLREREQWDR
jgi:antitoxin PrlF